LFHLLRPLFNLPATVARFKIWFSENAGGFLAAFVFAMNLSKEATD